MNGVSDTHPCGYFASKNAIGQCECSHKYMTWDEGQKKCLCKNGKSSINCDIDVCEIAGSRWCKLFRFYRKCRDVFLEFAPSNVEPCVCSRLSYDPDARNYESVLLNKACNYQPPTTTKRYSGGSDSVGYKSLGDNRNNESKLSLKVIDNIPMTVLIPIAFILLVITCFIFKKICHRVNGSNSDHRYDAPPQETVETGLNTPAYTTSTYIYTPTDQQANVPSTPLLSPHLGSALPTLHTDYRNSSADVGPSAPFQWSSSNDPDDDGNKVPQTPPPAYNEIYK